MWCCLFCTSLVLPLHIILHYAYAGSIFLLLRLIGSLRICNHDCSKTSVTKQNNLCVRMVDFRAVFCQFVIAFVSFYFFMNNRGLVRVHTGWVRDEGNRHPKRVFIHFLLSISNDVILRAWHRYKDFHIPKLSLCPMKSFVFKI